MRFRTTITGPRRRPTGSAGRPTTRFLQVACGQPDAGAGATAGGFDRTEPGEQGPRRRADQCRADQPRQSRLGRRGPAHACAGVQGWAFGAVLRPAAVRACPAARRSTAARSRPRRRADADPLHVAPARRPGRRPLVSPANGSRGSGPDRRSHDRRAGGAVAERFLQPAKVGGDRGRTGGAGSNRRQGLRRGQACRRQDGQSASASRGPGAPGREAVREMPRSS